jgi:hypothetical protein
LRRGRKELLVATVKREAQTSWLAEADELRKRVDEAGANLKAVYTTSAGAIVTVFRAAAELDKLVDAVNSRAPAGMNQLRRVEATARNIPSLHPTDVSVIEKTTLPPLLFGHNVGTVVNEWPPKPQNIGLEYTAMIAQACGAVSASSWDDGYWEFAFDEKKGHYDWRRKPGAPPPPPIRGAAMAPSPAEVTKRQLEFLEAQERGREAKAC